jgi:hypothetical protein
MVLRSPTAGELGPGLSNRPATSVHRKHVVVFDARSSLDHGGHVSSGHTSDGNAAVFEVTGIEEFANIAIFRRRWWTET